MWKIIVNLKETKEIAQFRVDKENEIRSQSPHDKFGNYKKVYSQYVKWTNDEKHQIINALSVAVPDKVEFNDFVTQQRGVSIHFKYGTTSYDGKYAESEYDAQIKSIELIDRCISILSNFSLEAEGSSVSKLSYYQE